METTGFGDGLEAMIQAAVWPSFFVPVQMGDETVNGANTGVCGRFMACGWGCVGYDKGRGKEWGLNPNPSLEDFAFFLSMNRIEKAYCVSIQMLLRWYNLL